MSQTPAPIGLYFGSTTGTTEDVTLRFEAMANEKFGLDLLAVNIADVEDDDTFLAHPAMILAIPTWNYGELQDDWELFLDRIKGKPTSATIAIIGVGDQFGYPEYFLDAVGIMGRQLEEQGAKLVGEWPIDDYDYEESQALIGDFFMGVGIDEWNQPEKTDERLEQWLTQILPELQS